MSGGLVALLAVLFLLSISTGSNPVPLWQAIGEVLTGSPSLFAVIVTEIRLPRTLIALVSGASLGLCGAAIQGLLRNPLASPGLVGSSSGAAFGAVVVFYFGIGASFALALPFGGIIGALGATFLVYLLAGNGGSSATLILAGVAINALALSLISLLLNLAPSPYAVQEIVLWMLGSMANTSLDDLWIILPCTGAGWLLLAGTGRGLDALTLGEETAFSMGVSVATLRWRIFGAIALAVGSAVSVTGTIGFVGLVVPHLMRPLVGYQPSRLLPVSALAGAILLLSADIGVRLFSSGSELQVGVVTSLIGAPFFLYLILKTRREFP